MPGPIDRAFVEIVARLETGDIENELSASIRRAVRRAEPLFKRLEKAGVDAGKDISRQFDKISIDLNVRQALSAIEKLDERSQALQRRLRSVDKFIFTFRDEKAKKSLIELDNLVEKIGRAHV